METLPAENSNLFLTTEAHDQDYNQMHGDQAVGLELEEVCEERESYNHTYRSGVTISVPQSHAKY